MHYYIINWALIRLRRNQTASGMQPPYFYTPRPKILVGPIFGLDSMSDDERLMYDWPIGWGPSQRQQ